MAGLISVLGNDGGLGSGKSYPGFFCVFFEKALNLFLKAIFLAKMLGKIGFRFLLQPHVLPWFKECLPLT